MKTCMNTVSDYSNVREAVCVSVEKIMDACRGQSCMENVPVYLTRESQETLEKATSVKARCAELIYAAVSAEPVSYQNGYFTVDVMYFYRVIADAVLGVCRPAAIYGLAAFNKCVTLYGGENPAKHFSSNGGYSCNRPTAVVEAIDPVVLQAKIVDVCHRRGDDGCMCLGEGLPETVAAAFDDDLAFGGMNRQLVVTLGQFSIVRLQRETQLLIPSYDYCLPGEECCEDSGCIQESPCEAFARMSFPVQEFFPESDEGKICGEHSGSCGSVGTAATANSGDCSCEAARAVLVAPQEANGEDSAYDDENTLRTIPTGNRGQQRKRS